ncbi:MAG TPA: ParA family protein [Gemmatimonadaceae bacterium]|nr:ParA family protein [Gemmatimonadaceae bacterium]
MTRVIAVTGAKGGTGKTTTAVNLAAALAERGYRVELRDLDPQASATRALGQRPVEDPAAAPSVPLRHARLPDGLLLLRPSGHALIGVEQHESDGGRPDAGAAALLAPHPRWRADVLVVDCPPALGNLTTTALRAAELALVPLEPTPLAFTALEDLADALTTLRPRRPRLRAVVTRFQQRRLLSAEMLAHIDGFFPTLLFDTRIPEDVHAAEAPGAALPVTLFAPSAPSSAAYRALAGEVVEDMDLGRPSGSLYAERS